MTDDSQKPAPSPDPSVPASGEKPVEVEATPFDPARESGKTVDVPPPPPPPPPPGGGGGSGGTPSPGAGPASPAPQSNLAWAMACHLATLIDFGFTFLVYGFLPPLVIWLWKKDADPEVAHHGKESLNFQLNLLFWYLVSLPLCLCCIGIVALAALPVIKIVLVVIAALRTADGERYRYPYIYRVIE